MKPNMDYSVTENMLMKIQMESLSVPPKPVSNERLGS